MGYVKNVKELMRKELLSKFSNYRNFLLLEFKGLNAIQSMQLRRQLREDNVGLHVVKNSIARFVFKELGLTDFNDHLKEMNSVAFADDPIVMAKRIVSFMVKNKALTIRSGYIEGQILDLAQVVELSSMPSRSGMIAIFIATMASPIRSLVTLLNSIPVSFLNLFEAIKDKPSQSEDKQGPPKADQAKISEGG